MPLRTEIKDKITESNRLKALLAAEFNVTTPTIDNWVQKDNPMLVTISARHVIREETGLTDAEILTTEDEKIRA